MSTAGRIFIVLNLVLAGTFLYASGTYLRYHTDYKAQLEETIESKDAEIADLESQLETERNELAEASRQVNGLQQTNGALNAQVAEKDQEIERLNKRLASLGQDISLLQSSNQTLADKVESAFNKSTEAWDKAIAAESERDQAMRAKDEAVANYESATRRISDLEGQIENQNAQIASLTSETKKQQIMLEVARGNGFLDQMATPTLNGRVTEARGDLVTIAITENPSSVEAGAMKGSLIAIYDESGYKGDVRITDARDADGRTFAFGKVYVPVEGKSIEVGDNASTQTQ